MSKNTTESEIQLSKAQAGLDFTRAAVANFSPTSEADFLKYYRRIVDPSQKYAFLHALAIDETFTEKREPAKASRVDPYDSRRVKLRQNALKLSREYNSESLDREVTFQAAASFKLLLELLNREDLVPCFLEHVTAGSLKGTAVDRFRAYRKNPVAQDIFGALQLAVHCGLATPAEPTVQTRSNQLNLFAATIAYAQLRLSNVIKKTDEKNSTKYQRRTARQQILIFALTQLQELNPQLRSYLLALHGRDFKEWGP